MARIANIDGGRKSGDAALGVNGMAEADAVEDTTPRSEAAGLPSLASMERSNRTPSQLLPGRRGCCSIPITDRRIVRLASPPPLLPWRTEAAAREAVAILGTGAIRTTPGEAARRRLRTRLRRCWGTARAPTQQARPHRWSIRLRLRPGRSPSGGGLRLRLSTAATLALQQAAASDDEEEGASESMRGLAHPSLGTVVFGNKLKEFLADSNLFHFDVAITPKPKSTAVNREVLAELIKLYGKTSLGGKLAVYDGSTALYTAGPLPFESQKFVVQMAFTENKEKGSYLLPFQFIVWTLSSRSQYESLVEQTSATFSSSCVDDRWTFLIKPYSFLMLCSGTVHPGDITGCLQFPGNIIFTEAIVALSRSFFSTMFGRKGEIGEGPQWLCRPHMGLSPNTDIAATCFSKPVTVIRFVEQFLGIHDSSRPLSGRDCVKIKKALIGVCIETTYLDDQIRKYKIKGITSIPMSQIIIPTGEKGMRKTVVEYFLEKYGYKLNYVCWPCLQVGSDSCPLYLPMEVCMIIEGKRYYKKLKESEVITDMVRHNKYAEGTFAQQFGIKPSSNLVPVPPHVIPPPPLLKYHDCSREKTPEVHPDTPPYDFVNLIKSLTCIHDEGSLPGSEEREKKEKESNIERDVCKVFKKISVGISRKLVKFGSKDETWKFHLPSLLYEVIICRPLAVFAYIPLDLILGGGQARFDRWLLPQELRNPYLPTSTAWVSFLNSFSRYLIHQLLVCVCREGHEALGITWDDAFTTSDIWLCNGGVMINPNVPSREYEAGGGQADYDTLYHIISTSFYDFYSRRYPLYLRSLLHELETCPDENRRQHSFVTFLINRPALISYTDRMEIYTSTGTMFRQLPLNHRQTLNTLLNIQEYDSWGLAVDLIPDLSTTYNYGGIPHYGDSLSSCLQFGRNYLSHFATRFLKNAGAALVLNLEFLLPCVLRIMILDFQGPPEWYILSVLENTNADRVNVLL
ncbi:hypothetical protein C2845_PM11G24510 [Panicum miliaceum]|uniref:PAZ domain-containing protein n=1 Tax=Panicum miliaceum TaxID=4540 RepID=A0A3L6RNT3_PANMI|nr:hypothetical protein C2845_PM11G24510 [Panicum miliaceum]